MERAGVGVEDRGGCGVSGIFVYARLHLCLSVPVFVSTRLCLCKARTIVPRSHLFSAVEFKKSSWMLFVERDSFGHWHWQHA